MKTRIIVSVVPGRNKNQIVWGAEGDLVPLAAELISLAVGAQIDKAISVTPVGVPIAMEIGHDHRHAGFNRPEARIGLSER